MNKLQLLQRFRDIGESNEHKSAVAYTVYLDLLEFQISVDYFYDADIQSIFFKQEQCDGNIDIILPISINENVDLVRLHRIRTEFCKRNNGQFGLVGAFVGANGAVIYQRFTDGKVLDFRIQN